MRQKDVALNVIANVNGKAIYLGVQIVEQYLGMSRRGRKRVYG